MTGPGDSLEFTPAPLRPGPLPKYMQIYTQLRDYTTGPEGRTFGRLPTERTLQQMFGVSRKTVRNALAVLADARLVCRTRRRGTLVAAQVTPEDPQSPIQRIGLVFPALRMPFWDPLLAAFRRTADGNGYRAVDFFYEVLDPVCEERRLRDAARQCDGLLYYPCLERRDERTATELLRQSKPFVIFDLCPATLRCDAVAIDHFLGAMLLTERLFDAGVKRPCMVVNSEKIVSNALQLQGVRAAFERHGVPFDDDRLFRVDENFSNDRLIDFLQTGHSDGVQAVAWNLLHEFNLFHPGLLPFFQARNFALAAFDILPERLDRVPVRCFSAVQPREEMGETLFFLLRDRLKNSTASPKKVWIVPTILSHTPDDGPAAPERPV